jgi:Ca2+/Na+ antiporter
VNVYLTGGAMFLAGLFAIIFMKTDKILSKKEGLILIFFYIIFVLAEFFASKIIGTI